MVSERISVQSIMGAQEMQRLDAFAREHAGAASLPAWAAFLRLAFGQELTLDPDIIRGYAVDSSNLPGRALALGRPADERECARLLRLAFRAGICCTVSAGRSNLTGSATPPGGMILSLAHLTRPGVRLDPAASAATAPVGILLEDFRREILRRTDRRRMFPVDPTSRAEATLGGAVACNASGFTPGVSGSIRDWVTAVEFLLPDGRKISAERGQYRSAAGRFVLIDGETETEWPVPTYPRALIKNAGGPFSDAGGIMDFIDLVVGSEGLFGVVTACTLKLADRPADYVDLFVPLREEACALRLLEAIRRHCAGDLGRLTACEYFGVHCRRFMDHAERLFRGDNQVAVYLQAPAPAGVDPAALAEDWFECCLAAGADIDGDAVLLLDNERDRALFLEARHSLPAHALEVVQRRGTYTLMTDAVVPPEHFAGFLECTHAYLRDAGIEYVSFGHLGDCHLHFTLLPEKNQIDSATAVYEEIVAEAARRGGVYSGEHGTGKRKRGDFLACHGERGALEIRRCKAAVDPHFLLNRDNVVTPGPPND